MREAFAFASGEDAFRLAGFEGLRYARALTEAPADISATDVEALRQAGFDDGEILADSAVIVDYLDYLAGPERALMPQSGWERYRMLSLLSISTAAAEKVVAAYMERLRPDENQDEPSIENAVRQAKDGFEYLNAAVVGPWMIGDKLTQLDISTVAYVEFVNHSVPEIKEAMHCPKLNSVIERALELPAFQKTSI